MAHVGIVSYRLGGADGVSVEAAKWSWALERLGADVRLIAGAGPEGVELVEGLGIDDERPVDRARLEAVLEDLDVVIVENLCSLPLNPRAGDAVAAALAGRPAILHHHDLPWHRADTAHLGAPPDDPCWVHVTISQLHARELAEHGVDARVVYNRFDLDPPPGDRVATRRALGIGDDELLVLQPTRALRRKNVPGGLALAEDLGAIYWLTAEAEDGYGPELAELLEATSVRVLRGPGPGSIHDAYAACDLVVLPSTWEGFGNPVIESVSHRRLLALGSYPVAAEIRGLGFELPRSDDPRAVARLLGEPDELRNTRFEAHLGLAAAHFDLEGLPAALADLLAAIGR
jgi:mannosylglucosylglycerate synthase